MLIVFRVKQKQQEKMFSRAKVEERKRKKERKIK